MTITKLRSYVKLKLHQCNLKPFSLLRLNRIILKIDENSFEKIFNNFTIEQKDRQKFTEPIP